MKRSNRTGVVAASAALILTAAACASTVAESDGDRMTGVVEIAEGVEVNLDDCPSSWSETQGITDDKITLGISMPQSGALASIGGLAKGVQAWFDHVNVTDPIDGKEVEVDIRDDAYDAARTKTNVEDMIGSGDTFAFVYVTGTPNNKVVQPIIEESCTPHLVGGAGDLDLMGHPDENPWTQGGLFIDANEAKLWCEDIVNRHGEGTKVAYLVMDNDYGDVYANGIRDCAVGGRIDLVSEQRHSPTAPSVTNQVTTMASSGAEVVVLGTSGSFCGQGLSGIAASSWDPQVYVAITCSQVGSTFASVDPAGDGTRAALNRKDVSDPQWADDEDVQETVEVLEAAGLSSTDTAPNGVFLARYIEHTLRAAADMEGGLNRVNLLKAMWNTDYQNPQALPGIRYRTDGVDDPLLFDEVRFGTYVAPAAGEEYGHFEIDSEVVSVNE